MTRKQLLTRATKAAERYVKRQLGSEGSHDWQHIQRVHRTALKIARQEKADIALVELMAILHEATDWKLIGRKTTTQAAHKLTTWLKQQKLATSDIEHITYVIKNQSFSVSGVSSIQLTSLEGKIVQDADRLEAIGAIGIARCFAYGGKTGRPLYDPNKQRGRYGTSASINHFYEKLLKIKDLMNTKTGKKIARRRHQFMQKYLVQFFAEIEGKK